MTTASDQTAAPGAADHAAPVPAEAGGKRHRCIRGSIRYTSEQPGRMGAERGREWFQITQQSDGVDVLLAHCEIDDAPDVVRDVMLAMRHQDSSPLDCSVRISVGGQFEGSGWFRFEDGKAVCHAINQQSGVSSEEMPCTGHARWLQAHPIAGDALLMRIYDLSKGPGKQRLPELFLTSPDHRGATGPMLFKMGLSLVFVGEESITVAAGRFDAWHFQVTDTAEGLPEEHPPYDLWCTADGDYLFLRAIAGGYMQNRYELTELEIED